MGFHFLVLDSLGEVDQFESFFRQSRYKERHQDGSQEGIIIPCTEKAVLDTKLYADS